MSNDLMEYAPDQQVMTTVGDILIFAEEAYRLGWIRGTLGGLENNPFTHKIDLEQEATDQSVDNDRDDFPYDLGDA